VEKIVYVVNLDRKMQFEALAKEDAEKIRVKYLINKPAGARNFHLTYYSVATGGRTPLDRHVNEHEVFIMKGRGRLVGANEQHDLTPGDAIYIKSNEVHQFLNTGNEPFEFLCVKGADELYETERSSS
jgi:mannose-6-phosphate isomerase-like protein (cupin superfamily)